MTIVGVDPGKSGWASYLDGPTLQRIPLRDLAQLKKRLWDLSPVFLVEKQQGSGRMSDFNYGWHCGQLWMVMESLGPVHEVSAQKWQRRYCVRGLSRSVRKTALWGEAKKLFPQGRITKEAADSVLILHYALHSSPEVKPYALEQSLTH